MTSPAGVVQRGICTKDEREIIHYSAVCAVHSAHVHGLNLLEHHFDYHTGCEALRNPCYTNVCVCLYHIRIYIYIYII